MRPEKATLAGLGQGNAQVPHCQRIFTADVDEASCSPYRPGADQHTLDNAVGVRLQYAAIHERAGISLVCITYDVFGVAWFLTAQLPLRTSRETRPTSAAQPGSAYLIDDALGFHFT